MIIALSRGHYPASPGAVFHGVTEWGLICELYDILSDYLIAAQISVYQVPTGGLVQKVKAINESPADLAIELHFNAGGDENTSGVECLHFPGNNRTKALCESICAIVAHEMAVPDRGAKQAWYRMDAPGRVDWEGDVEGDEHLNYFVEKTRCPSIIIEPEFIQHAAYWTTHHMADCSKAICRAIKETW